LAKITRSRRPSTPAAQALTPEELAWRCPPALLVPLRGVEEEHGALIGQSRALDALRLGLTIESPGHNIFVCGPSGTGKMSTVRALLKRRPQRDRPLYDYAYVHNFSDPDRPRLLRMPAGTARKFRKEFEKLVVELPETCIACSRPTRSSDAARRPPSPTSPSSVNSSAPSSGRARSSSSSSRRCRSVRRQHLEIYPVLPEETHRHRGASSELVATGKARVNRASTSSRRHTRP
jgi:Cdc6-like AAA superfamily ATPase